MSSVPTTYANTYKIAFTPNLPWFTQPVTLQGVDYVLEFQFNARESRWYMDILDVSENPLLRGIALNINRDLNGQYGSYLLPRGLFFARDDSGAGLPPTFNSFCVDHSLLFVDLS